MSLLHNFLSGIKYNKYHVLAFGIVAFFAHPFYWLWWTYVFPNPYENEYLRIFGSLSALVMIVMILNEEKFKKIVPIYWIFVVIYNLPFTFTFLMFKNHLAEIWLMAEIIMIFVVFLFVPNFFGAMAVFVVGVIVSAVLALLTGEKVIYPANLLFSHSIIYFLAIVAGFIFNKTNIMGVKLMEQERAQVFKSLAGSIAHELRNPLNTINLLGDQIKDALVGGVNSSTQEKLNVLASQISESISGANNIINIILSDLSEKPVDDAEFVYLKPQNVIPHILQNYGYKTNEEKNRVRFVVDDGSDFVFRAVSERFTFIVYNLLKNALYYVREYPNSEVVVGTETRTIKDKEWNVIYVHDTGPGIAPDVIEKLFGDFFTSGKKDGTGLGLAFCKRNMQIFGGDIICESELGKWTKFSLLFPKVLSEEIRKTEVKLDAKKLEKDDLKLLNGKNILIADDQEMGRIVFEKKLKSLGVNAQTAKDGAELVKIYRDNLKPNGKSKFDFIITDLNMPIKNGDEAIAEIRAIEQDNKIAPNDEISVVIVSGDEEEKLAKKLEELRITGYFVKGSDVAELLKIIVKSKNQN